MRPTDGDADQLGRIVVGLFSQRERAEDAIRALHYAGFGSGQVDIATRDGGALVTVQEDARFAEAQEILRRHGADLDQPGLTEQMEHSYSGDNRRDHDDLAYAGPERRLAEY